MKRCSIANVKPLSNNQTSHFCIFIVYVYVFWFYVMETIMLIYHIFPTRIKKPNQQLQNASIIIDCIIKNATKIPNK